MKDISVDDLLKKTNNRFLLANAVSERSKQISEGSLPYIDDFNPTSPISTAFKEIAKERVTVKIGSPQAAKKESPAQKEDAKERLSLKKEKKSKKTKKKK